MARDHNFLDPLLDRRSVRRWARAAGAAVRTAPVTLRAVRSRALQVRRAIDQFLHAADVRLLPGADAIHKPLGTDWAWRPDLWRGPLRPAGQAAVLTRARFGDQVAVFHDCRGSELTLRQVRNSLPDDLAPFGVGLDILGFDGSFLSLAIAVPLDAAQSLTARHILRVQAVVEVERPVRIYARLNAKHGPNTKELLREMLVSGVDRLAEFDLGEGFQGIGRLDEAWLDLIFEAPGMNHVLLRDVTLTRRLRAQV